MRQRKEAPQGATSQVVGEDYLDEQEQEEVIEEFQRQAARQERYVKQLVGLLGFLLAAVYVLFAAHQVLLPFGTRHHAAFEGTLKPAAVMFGELGGAAAVVLATASLLLFERDQPQRVWKQLLQLSGTLAMFEALFWTTAVYKAVRHAGTAGLWRLLWLPAAPAAFVIIIMKCIDLLALPPELAVLRASRYRFKKA